MDYFNELGPADNFDIKKDEVAAQMAGFLAHCNVSRSTLTQQTGWPRSRVSHIFSGKTNLTLKTIYEFSSALKKDFSIVFHDVGVTCFSQAWHPSANLYFTPNWVGRPSSTTCLFAVQTASQIADDLEAGIDKKMYFSLFNADTDGAITLIENNRTHDFGLPLIKLSTVHASEE